MTTKQIMINGLMFATGAAIGSLVTWRIMRTRCDKLITEEVEAFKKDWPNYVGKRVEINPVDDHWDGWNGCEEEDDDDDEDDSDGVYDYRRIADQYITEEGGGDSDTFIVEGPIVITPDEFIDIEFGWSMHALTYYAGDGVLADDWDVKQAIEDTIGEEALECFGKYSEEDVVHVRNEENMAHYEVVRDPRKYADVLAGSNPHADMNAD